MRFNFEDGSFKDYSVSKKIVGLKQRNKRPLSVTLTHEDIYEMGISKLGLVRTLIEIQAKLHYEHKK